MKLVGAHSILYSKDAQADRAFLRDVMHFPRRRSRPSPPRSAFLSR